MIQNMRRLWELQNCLCMKSWLRWGSFLSAAFMLANKYNQQRLIGQIRTRELPSSNLSLLSLHIQKMNRNSDFNHTTEEKAQVALMLELFWSCQAQLAKMALPELCLRKLYAFIDPDARGFQTFNHFYQSLKQSALIDDNAQLQGGAAFLWTLLSKSKKHPVGIKNFTLLLSHTDNSSHPYQSKDFVESSLFQGAAIKEYGKKILHLCLQQQIQISRFLSRNKICPRKLAQIFNKVSQNGTLQVEELFKFVNASRQDKDKYQAMLEHLSGASQDSFVSYFSLGVAYQTNFTSLGSHPNLDNKGSFLNCKNERRLKTQESVSLQQEPSLKKGLWSNNWLNKNQANPHSCIQSEEQSKKKSYLVGSQGKRVRTSTPVTENGYKKNLNKLSVLKTQLSLFSGKEMGSAMKSSCGSTPKNSEWNYRLKFQNSSKHQSHLRIMEIEKMANMKLLEKKNNKGRFVNKLRN